MKKKNSVQKQNNAEPHQYAQFLEHIKTDILQTQLKAALSVTKELTLLYWRIGKELSQKAQLEGWGAKVVDKLAHDLETLFPGIAGFSLRNLKYMKKFAESYPDEISATAVAQIPWGHNIALLEKLQDTKQRFWYAEKTIENGWSRTLLLSWIESKLHTRQGKAVNNFKATLPASTSDLAIQTLKDPYIFDFLVMDLKAKEREVEQGLMTHIQKFLLELGQGFSFVGQQYHLEVGNQDYYIDLLFYHLKLRCFIVVELKNTEFIPEYAGKLNFYLSAIDDLLRTADDQPTIGLLLCKSKNNYVAEYALRDIKKPVGISSYTTKLIESLPKKFKGKLPSIAEIEAELGKTTNLEKKLLKHKK